MDHGVNKVTEDFSGVMLRRFFLAHLTIVGKELLSRSDRRDALRVLSASVSATVTSSAYADPVLVGEGQSPEKKL